jgi:hypothetical protein
VCIKWSCKASRDEQGYAMHICVSQVVISNKTEVDARRIGWDDMKGIHLAEDRGHIFCEQCYAFWVTKHQNLLKS